MSFLINKGAQLWNHQKEYIVITKLELDVLILLKKKS